MKSGNKVLNIFGIVMAAVYTLLGIFMLIQKQVLNFSELQRIGLGIVLILYGIFRFYKVKKKSQESDEFESES